MRTRSRTSSASATSSFGHVDASELRVKPNLPLLGPKLGQGARGGARGARRPASSRSSPTAGSAWPATTSRATRCSSSGTARRAGRLPRRTALTVALDLHLDDELVRAGRVYDLIHAVNTMRKEAGLELTDRIRLDDPRGGRRPPRALGLDRARDARRLGRPPAPSSAREELVAATKTTTTMARDRSR